MSLQGLKPDHMRIKLSENFFQDEFDCPCGLCGEPKIDLVFLHLLQVARDASQLPFIVTSGYRCREYQESLNSDVTGPSAHEKGMAADIAADNSMERYNLVTSLLHAGFNRIGIYDKHIHVDSDPDKPSGVIWVGISK